jgi:hypothetical protein
MKWIKEPFGLCILFPLFCISCATLDVNEIKDLHRTEFNPVELSPGYEINNLRIDLIRRNYTENVNDSVTETKDSPYHPLGFNLGNGLFYDINENLCLKLDFLLGYSADKNFEIHESYRANHKRGIIVYRFHNDTFKVNYMYGKNLHYRYHLAADSSVTKVLYKNKVKYSMAFTDTSAIYTENMGKPRIIQQAGRDQYDLNIRKRKDHFSKTAEDIFLNNDYAVSLAKDHLSLEIKNPRKKKNNTLYTIVKSDSLIFVYDRRYSGIKIGLNKDNILLYRNNILKTKFELKL